MAVASDLTEEIRRGVDDAAPRITEVRLTEEIRRGVDDAAPRITEVRLTAFKSFRDEVLPLGPLTILTGLNGAGKSNALDAIEVLAGLASGASLSFVLRETRGGAEGSAPHGTSRIELGCTVELDGAGYRWDLTIDVAGEPRVARESLTAATGISAVRAALVGVFHLDPIPARMRQFVPAHQVRLRRDADNLSATMASLSEQHPGEFNGLVALADRLQGGRVPGIDFERTTLDDVMFTLRERSAVGADTGSTPAREVSDGLLRVLAVGCAVGATRDHLDLPAPPHPGVVSARPLLVVEEVENGLHPSQAGYVLDLVRDAATQQTKSILLTTHSSALLDDATGALNDDILVCYRAPATGYSHIARLPELEGYLDAMISGPIGRNVASGRLTGPISEEIDRHGLDDLFGIDR
ncbi:AAA family ATPase [Tsukamurella soli]|uniref:AAA family ATPase n=1 Tax=Tsukamurella soli TaxID=644556 RepID=UPI0031F02D56